MQKDKKSDATGFVANQNLSFDLKIKGSVSEPQKHATTTTGAGASKVAHEDLSQDIDSDVISNYIGHISHWSLIWIILLSSFQIPTSFHMFVIVFMAAPTKFWCARPEHLMHVNPTEWMNVSQSPDGCRILDIDFAKVDYVNGQWINLPATGHNISLAECSKFEFASDDDGSAKTIVQEFGLICNQRNVLSVVEMTFLAGAALGSVSSGWISDRYGRRHTLMIFASIQTLIGIALAFATSLAMFMVFRFIMGFASMTVTIVSFVLVVELVSGKWRTIIGILNILPVALSYILIAAIAYFVRDWRRLQLVISAPWLALLTIWFWLPESPRWLLACGRLNELFVIINRASKVNGRVLPDDYEIALQAVAPIQAKGKSESLEKGSTADQKADKSIVPEINPLFVIFSRKYVRTTCLTLVIWLALIIIYFGLTLHLNNLGGNIYFNTAIAGLVESISILVSISVVLKIGIRYSLIIYMLIPGICCLATNIVPKGDNNTLFVIALAMIAKCMIGANNAIIPTYTAMQYPTVVRNFGVGMGNLAAGIGLILVPYIWHLETFESLLPVSVMGVCGLIGAIALALMKDVK